MEVRVRKMGEEKELVCLAGSELEGILEGVKREVLVAVKAADKVAARGERVNLRKIIQPSDSVHF